ncbi:MAG: hydrogenase 4 subunit F [Candidatus Thermoplasmatota archaeon]|jgi:hydrogenase-4 component F|nr:hydrogenase 4 subunit F [Candidatus Thermoplasmatota archaeon]MCL5988141.1 hydrogenase 4 subunit F [Candidatus Thermoplasmatota archaeon]
MISGTYFISLMLVIPVISTISYFFRHFKEISIAMSLATLLFTAIVFTLNSGTYSYFYLNNINRYILICVSSIYVFSVIYGTGYHRKLGESKHLKIHMSMMSMFAFTMLFSLVINNLGLMWIGIEGTTASSALLIIIEGEPADMEAAWRYIIIVSAGLSIALISIILIYRVFGTLEITALLSYSSQPSQILLLAALLGIIGFGTKGGIFPMHSWLPDAHGRAPSEISAMFSAVLLPIAIYAIYIIVKTINITLIYETTTLFSVITILFVALVMASQRDIKRMFAYSTMENMALILLGFVLGNVALFGSILIILTHAFAKAGAFYSSGNLIESYHTRNMFQIQNVIGEQRPMAYTLILSTLAVSGTPPFGTFLGEFFIFSALYSQGMGIVMAILAILLVIIFLSINYKVLKMVFSIAPPVFTPKISAQQIFITGATVAVSGIFAFLFMVGIL